MNEVICDLRFGTSRAEQKETKGANDKAMPGIADLEAVKRAGVIVPTDFELLCLGLRFLCYLL
jgi:hypothetical protein